MNGNTRDCFIGLSDSSADSFADALELSQIQEITKSIPLSRLSEICNAEREGRCVVLPCRCGGCRYRNDAGHCTHQRHYGMLPNAYQQDFCAYAEPRAESDALKGGAV